MEELKDFTDKEIQDMLAIVSGNKEKPKFFQEALDFMGQFFDSLSDRIKQYPPQ